MTIDTVTFVVSVRSQTAADMVQEAVVNSASGSDTFEGEITSSSDSKLEVEVTGDSYEIPVFEEAISEISGASVESADVK